MKNELYAKVKTWVGDALMDYTFFLVRYSEKNLLGKLLCSFHHSFLKLFDITFLPVESAVTYREKYNSCEITAIRNNRTGFVSEPAFDVKKSKLIIEERQLPDLNLYHFYDVMVHGNSDIVVDKTHRCVINDYCYDLDKNVKFVDGLLYQLKSNICILRSNLRHSSRRLPAGLMITGKFSKNFYHEILENLIKLVFLNELNVPERVPIIVDESVKNVPAFSFILSTLLQHSQRSIVYVGFNEIVSFEELYVISNVNRITPHLVNRPAKKDDIVFDVEALRKMRDSLLFFKTNTSTPTKIFLTRKNTSHRNFNEEEILNLLEPLGFVAIAPEEYSFQEQISIFNNSDFIIGGTGAAFTNLLFLKSGCKVLCIRPNVKGSPSGFTVLSAINHAYFLYYRSDENRTSDNIHQDYFVNPYKFKDFLMDFISYEA